MSENHEKINTSNLLRAWFISYSIRRWRYVALRDMLAIGAGVVTFALTGSDALAYLAGVAVEVLFTLYDISTSGTESNSQHMRVA